MILRFEELEVRRVLAATAQVSVLSFDAPVTSPIAEARSHVSEAHLNDDEFVDLLLASSGGELDILFGDGSGQFTQHVTYSNLGAVTSIDVGDLNQDGLPDLAIGSTTAVTTMIGVGVGDWNAISQFGGTNVSDVTLVDLDGDEILDLVVRQNREIVTKFGLGDGLFGETITYVGDAFSGLWTDGLIGDVNQDGHPDIVRSTNDASEVLLNDGSGIFEDAVAIPNIERARALRDVTGDGILDLISGRIIVSNVATSSSLAFHIGNGDATFGEAVDQISFAGLPDNVSVSDIDQDGRGDLFFHQAVGAHNLSGSGPNVFLGNGDGSFEAGIRVTSQLTSSVGMLTTDVDNDGVTELITSRGGELLTFSTTSTGRFSDLAPSYALGSAIIRNHLVGDINGDGLVDLVGSEATGSEIYYRLATAGEFGDEQTVVLDGGSTVSNLKLVNGDFDGDGRFELAVTGRDSLNVDRIFVVDAATASVDLARSTALDPGNIASPIPTDVNDDGRLDFVVGKTDELATYLNQPSGWILHEQSIADWAGNIVEVDANSDSLPDLLLQGRVYENLGDGSWSPWDKESGTLTDLNRDGFVDLVSSVVVGIDSLVTVRLSATDGSWMVPENEGVTIESTEFHLSDANGDGVDDLVFTVGTGTSDSSVRVLLSDGAGGFGESIDSPFMSPSEYDSLILEDINDDGAVDITTTSRWGSHVFLGDGAGGFSVVNLPVDPLVVVRTSGFNTLIDVYDTQNGDVRLTTYAVPVRNPAGADPVVAQTDLGFDGDLDVIQSYDGGFVTLLAVGQGDFNRDGIPNGADVQLFRELEDPSEDEIARFDLDGDLALTESDIRVLVEDIANTKLGDTEFDGDVDFIDFLVLSTNFGMEDATWTDADFDGSGAVDFADFLMLASNFGFDRG